MLNIKHVKTVSDLFESLIYLGKKKRLALDTETTGLDPHTDKILLLQLGDTQTQFVFDVAKLGKDIAHLFPLLSEPGLQKIGHFLQFDYSMILTNFGISMPNLCCTHVGSSLLTKGLLSADNSLEGCLDKYLGIKIDKDVRKNFQDKKFGDEFSDEEIKYSAIDVEHLIPLQRKIQNFIDERGMTTLYELENETVRVCGDLEVNGIYLDRGMWLALKDQAREAMEKASLDLDEFFKPHLALDIFGKPVINYNSQQQLLPVLNKITGLKIKDTKEETLKEIDHPVIKALWNYRKAVKKVTTYGEEFVNKHIHPVTGRVHSNFRQLGTDSGRMASRDPNMQNIISEDAYRACFRAQHPDYRIISADFQGQELSLLAQISKEPKFIYALNNNMDLHAYSASLLFDIPYENFFEKDAQGNILYDDGGEPVFINEMKKQYRNPAKAVTFGLIYGMGPNKLARELNIEFHAALQLMNKYFETFPKIKQTLDKLVADAKYNKYAYSPLDGRRRLFSGIDWDHGGKAAHMFNIAKNQPFQGAGASVTKLALCKMKREIDNHGWDAKLILTVHDKQFSCRV